VRRRLATAALLAGLAGAAAPAGAAAVANAKVLTLEGATTVVAAAATEARRLQAGGAIAVVDDGGHLVALERLDGTFPAASAVASEKARTAATFRKPTQAFEEAIRAGRVSLVAVDVMTPLQGGVPLVVDGQVVGAVGVSGAANADEDTEIAKLAASALR